LILTILTFAFSNAYALGYVSRDCPQLGTKESITAAWFDSQWMYTFSVSLKKKKDSPYYSYDVRNSGSNWEKDWRSHAGILLGFGGDMSDYWAGVYGVHYWFNLDNMQSERRVKCLVPYNNMKDYPKIN
jgi:hypothetical protein